MKTIRQLGLAALLLWVGACTSKDPLLASYSNGGNGLGGVTGPGSGGGGAGGMSSGAGGAGGLSCHDALCGYTYKCVLTCGAQPVSFDCCRCEPPYFDERMEPACRDGGTDAPGSGGIGGASTGSGGATTGTGGTGGGTGGAGGATTGSGGGGGTTGSGGAGGMSTGSGGAGGMSTGTGGAGGMSTGTGGAGGRSCEDGSLCGTRPYQCIRYCGGPIEYEGCCPCQPPLFDNFNGFACRDAAVQDGPATRCADATSLAACDVLPDCHPVFFDPRTCGCAAIGCCARFHHCAEGAQARCTPPPQISCAVPTPYCESPAYVVSYSDICSVGCVRPTDCAP